MSDDETAPLIGREFLAILLVDFKLWLRIPDLFTDELRQFPFCELRMREESCEQPIWDVERLQDNSGRQYFGREWPRFTRHYSLQVGHILKFRYRGEGRLSVKIFDDTFYRRSFYPPLEVGFDPDDP